MSPGGPTWMPLWREEIVGLIGVWAQGYCGPTEDIIGAC